MHNNDWGKHSNRYCVPHRVMFGVDEFVCDTPRVIRAFTKACLKKGRDFYNPLVPELVEVSDVRLTELSKVVENVKRYGDVAFAGSFCSRKYYCRMSSKYSAEGAIVPSIPSRY